MQQAQTRKSAVDGRLPRVPSHWAEAVGVVVGALLVPLIVGVLAGLALLVGGGGLPSPTAILLVTAVGSLGMGGVVVGWVWMRCTRPPWAVLGFRPARPRSVLISLAGGVAGLAAVDLVLELAVPGQWQQTNALLDTLSRASTPQIVLLFLVVAVVAPLTEETVMRGYLFRAINQRVQHLPVAGFLVAAVSSSALFGIAHLLTSPQGLAYATVVSAFLVGTVLCWVYKKSGSLWPGIGLHAAFNAAAVLAVLVA